jgi:hypothetical protein
MVELKYAQNQNLIPYVQIYNVAMDQTTMKPSLEVTYSLKKGDAIVAEVKDLTGSTIQLFSGERVVLLTSIPLENILPGDYTLEVSVLDAIADDRHTVSTGFTVLEPEAGPEFQEGAASVNPRQ